MDQLFIPPMRLAFAFILMLIITALPGEGVAFAHSLANADDAAITLAQPVTEQPSETSLLSSCCDDAIEHASRAQPASSCSAGECAGTLPSLWKIAIRAEPAFSQRQRHARDEAQQSFRLRPPRA